MEAHERPLRILAPTLLEAGQWGRVRLKDPSLSPSGAAHAPLWFSKLFLGVGILVCCLTYRKSLEGEHVGVGIGSMFALFGLAMLSSNLREHLHLRRRDMITHGDPALLDYPWHPRWFEVRGWEEFLLSMVFAVVITVYCGAMILLVQADATKGFAEMAFIGFLLVTWCLVAAAAVRKLVEWLRFGPSRVEYDVLPLRRGRTVRFRWVAPRGCEKLRGGLITLRCVEEYMDIRVDASGRSHRKPVHDEVWRVRWGVDAGAALQKGDVVVLECDIPDDALPTLLKMEPVVFWQLEAKADLPGVDLSARYLVPVY